MPIEKKRLQLHTGGDLDGDRYSTADRDEDPATVAEVLADRASWTPPYGSAPLPDAPVWVSPSVDGTPVSAGGFRLFWRSDVGDIPAVPGNTGCAGLDGLGVTAHKLYITQAGTPDVSAVVALGPLLNVLVNEWLLSGTPVVLAPGNDYALQVAALSSAGEGPKSPVLHLTTKTPVLPAAA
ncbi:hypothetical protein ACFYUL_17925 [Streptomyces sp. NPDC004311]|uniref:hypothetical protein n=1 Tax=Streptomyces sp. NPDC004311 TaxID=3364698 RepID=UPI0036B6086F